MYQKKIGEVCLKNTECIFGFCSSTDKNTCQRPSYRNECNPNHNSCVDPYICSNSLNRCVPKTHTGLSSGSDSKLCRYDEFPSNYVNGTCLPRKKVGSNCKLSLECEDGLECHHEFLDKTVLRKCMKKCISEIDCPSDHECLSVVKGSRVGLCMKKINTTSSSNKKPDPFHYEKKAVPKLMEKRFFMFSSR